MKKFVVVPYRLGSAGAKNLKLGLEKALGTEVRREDVDYVIKSDEWVINWGAGHYRAYKKTGATGTRVFNSADKICLCVNKIDFFRVMADAGVTIPAWTTYHSTAERWSKAGDKIYCRTDTEGRDGRGILVAKSEKELVQSPLYTKGIDANTEYRVHIFQHEPIFDLEKWHENSRTNQDVRNGGNGWIYCRDTVVPVRAKQEAVKASKALGMDFCAIDILYNARTQVATVLEANSAPELGPWTRKAYAEKFIGLLRK